MKQSICNITDNTSGDQIRSYILETMSLIQQVRKRVNDLHNNSTILEDCEKQLFDANASLDTVNGLMGDIIGSTIADDIWEHQKVSL
jgi:hypothetical protein